MNIELEEKKLEAIKTLEKLDGETFLDANIKPTEEDKEHIFLRANTDGKPEYVEQTINGITYKAIKVADKIYTRQNTNNLIKNKPGATNSRLFSC